MANIGKPVAPGIVLPDPKSDPIVEPKPVSPQPVNNLF